MVCLRFRRVGGGRKLRSLARHTVQGIFRGKDPKEHVLQDKFPVGTKTGVSEVRLYFRNARPDVDGTYSLVPFRHVASAFSIRS